ncbi:NudC domain-containing protein 2 [Zea mays]|uniref:NudC domain-containing protein 2 n=1 Tax=Zea mays TaxID=4577 RepID=A0A1D6F2Q5_MAIZE|nr:NudC domain-containing protein 2 [Zea mays]
MYIELPKGVPTKLFHCSIQASHVEVGIRGNPPYLNVCVSSEDSLRFSSTQSPRFPDVWLWIDYFFGVILQHDLTHPVKTDSSFWTIEDGEMHITLQKREKGKTWSSPIQGQGILDPYAADQEQKRLMLQRFQEENPGFDFSQAQFSGTCPDPRTFMGGIRSE